MGHWGAGALGQKRKCSNLNGIYFPFYRRVKNFHPPVLVTLETKVRQTIDLINQLKMDKENLESQVEQLRDGVDTLNATIEDLQQRNAELLGYKEEIEIIKQQQEEEKRD